MASTITRILLHITFSTKDRAAIIPEANESGLFNYMGGICKRLNSPLLAAGAASDHVHLLLGLNKTLALSDLMLELKRDSSIWMKGNGVRRFSWQDGYFAFSIGESAVANTRRYIAGQRQRHAKMDFKDEVREFLSKYNLEWNEDHIWS